MPALMSKRSAAALGDIRREFDRRRKLAAVASGRIVKKSSSALSPIHDAPAGRAVVQKSSAPIPRKPAAASIIKRPSVPTPTPGARAIAYMPLGEAPQRCTAPKGRPTPFGIKGSGVANGGIKKAPAPVPHEPAGAPIKRPSVPTPRKPAEAATKMSYAPPPPPRSASAPISPATAPPPAAASKTIKKGSTVLVRTRVGALPSGMGLVLWLSARVVSDAEDGYFEVIYNGDFPRDDPFRTVRVARGQVKSMPSQQ